MSFDVGIEVDFFDLEFSRDGEHIFACGSFDLNNPDFPGNEEYALLVMYDRNLVVEWQW